MFNDVAIAIARLRRDGLDGDVLVLDLDVHQGDGNAELFADDPTVTVVSLHGARNYPFERVPSDLDVDLPDGTGDDAYLDALDGALAWALDDRAYVLAFLIAGADPWEHDALGRLALTEDGPRAARPARADGAARGRHPGLRHARRRLRPADRGHGAHPRPDGGPSGDHVRMLIRRLDDQEPFTTRDGSIIRELLNVVHPPIREPEPGRGHAAVRRGDRAPLPPRQRGDLLHPRRHAA